MDCLKNLTICNASCCQYIAISNGKKLSKEEIEYYQDRGIEVREYPDKHQLVIYLRCKALTDDFKCSLHFTPDKPRICLGLDENNFKDYFITKGCILENKGVNQGIIVPNAREYPEDWEEREDWIAFSGPLMPSDRIHYYQLRGCKVKRKGRNEHMILIPVKYRTLKDLSKKEFKFGLTESLIKPYTHNLKDNLERQNQWLENQNQLIQIGRR